MGTARSLSGLVIALTWAGCLKPPPPAPPPQSQPQQPPQPPPAKPQPPQPPPAKPQPPQAKPQPPQPPPKPNDLGGKPAADDARRPPPREVTQDDGYVNLEFQRLAPLRDPPAWLTARRLKRALGGKADEDELQRQLDAVKAGESDTLFFGPLDKARGLYLLSFHFGAGASGLVVMDAKSQGPPIPIAARGGRPLLRDIVGDDKPEVIVPSIMGEELSAFPLAWDIYTLAPGKRLTRIAVVPKEYVSGARSPSYCFLNRIEFPQKGIMRVETVLLARSKCEATGAGGLPIPKRLGERQEFEYVPAGQRFIPRIK